MTNPFSEIAETLAEIQRKIDHLTGTEEKQQEYINIDQACKLLNLSKSSIYKRTMNNDLPFYKHGKKLMFKRSELLRFIAGYKQNKPQHNGVIIEN